MEDTESISMKIMHARFLIAIAAVSETERATASRVQAYCIAHYDKEYCPRRDLPRGFEALQKEGFIYRKGDPEAILTPVCYTPTLKGYERVREIKRDAKNGGVCQKYLRRSTSPNVKRISDQQAA